MSIRGFFVTRFSNWDSTFRRFPLVLIFFAITTLLTVRAIGNPTNQDTKALLTIYPLSLGILLISLLRERYSWKPNVFASAVALNMVLAVALWCWYPNDLMAGFGAFSSFIIFWSITLSLHIIFALAPFLGRYKEQNFILFNRSIFYSFLVSLFFSLILYLGIILIIIALQTLFGLNFGDGRVYIRTFVVILGIFHTINFLSSFPQLPPDCSEHKEEHKGTSILLRYILIPLVSIYGLILIAYSIKIALGGVKIQTWVSELFMWFFISGIFTFYLNRSEINFHSKAFNKNYNKIWPIACLPMVFLFGFSLYYEKTQSGITDELYYKAMVFILFFVFLTYWILSPRKDVRFFLFLAVGLTLFSFLSGPLNSWNLSMASQKEIIVEELKKEKIIVNEKLVVLDTFHLSNERFDRSWQYVELRKSESFLKKYLPSDILNRDSVLEEVIQKIDRRGLGIDAKTQSDINYTYNQLTSTSLEGYSLLLPIISTYDEEPNNGSFLKITDDGGLIVFIEGVEKTRIFVQEKMVNFNQITTEMDGYRIKIIYTQFTAQKEVNHLVIQFLSGICLIDTKH